MPSDAPVEGDVQLVPLRGTAASTQVCDDVHLGGVELFRSGRWGRICAGAFISNGRAFTLDVTGVCRQLGFLFGTFMVADASGSMDYDPPEPPVTVWVTEVRPRIDSLHVAVFVNEFDSQPGPAGDRYQPPAVSKGIACLSCCTQLHACVGSDNIGSNACKPNLCKIKTRHKF